MRFASFVLLLCVTTASAADPAFKAGVAKATITPTEYMWMSGYGSRTKPAEGKAHDLFAKAVALEDVAGKRLVLVTTDLIGLSKAVTDDVFAGVAKETGLKREQVMFNSSHTHCGPVIADNLTVMFDLTPAQIKQITDYTATLRKQLKDLILAAVADLKPATLSHGQGEATFAMNRREKTPMGVINGKNRDGPVDHSVPVLKVTAADGKTLAIVFGYACHNTTQSYFKWCGDYAGFAQIEVEKANPGALALFWIGSGGDVNPQPRGTEELCILHGRELAAGVNKALAGDLKPIAGKFAAAYQQIDIAFDGSMTKEKLQAEALNKAVAVKNRANLLLKHLADHGKLPEGYPHYPVQVWALGNDLVWFGLGGEVVLDYAIQIRKELPKEKTVWVAGYCNDVMAYIPTKRMLAEGGYEADSSMIYYGMSGKWADTTEDRIIGKAKELAMEVAKK